MAGKLSQNICIYPSSVFCFPFAFSFDFALVGILYCLFLDIIFTFFFPNLFFIYYHSTLSQLKNHSCCTWCHSASLWPPLLLDIVHFNTHN